LQPDFLQRFLHFVEFEGFDHRLDLLHQVSFPRACQRCGAGVAAPTVSRVRAKPRRAKKAPVNQLFNGRGARHSSRRQRTLD
jgi:hypothetical protein